VPTGVEVHILRVARVSFSQKPSVWACLALLPPRFFTLVVPCWLIVPQLEQLIQMVDSSGWLYRIAIFSRSSKTQRNVWIITIELPSSYILLVKITSSCRDDLPPGIIIPFWIDKIHLFAGPCFRNFSLGCWDPRIQTNKCVITNCYGP